MRSSLLLALLLVVVAAAGGAHAQSLSAKTTGKCVSTFHFMTLTATVRNPSSEYVDLAELPSTAKRFQMDCLEVAQSIPASASRTCAGSLNQNLQICTIAAANSNSSAAWACTDATAYLTASLTTITVGDISGPELKMKLRWKLSVIDTSCYPRYFAVDIVGLNVPEPGTSVGASITFVIVVVCIAAAALAYGFYALWRVSKRFEHRQGSTERPLDDISGAENGDPVARAERDAYRHALKAMGVPDGMSSLYDEGGGETPPPALPGPPPPSGAAVQRPGARYEREEIGRYDDDDGGDDEDPNGGADEFRNDDDDEQQQYDDDETSPLSHRRQSRGVPAVTVGHRHQQHAHNNGPTHIVLDNSQVVQSVPLPVPWFERIEQEESARAAAAAAPRDNDRRTPASRMPPQQQYMYGGGGVVGGPPSARRPQPQYL